MVSSRSDLSSHLLDLDDHELSGFEWSETNDDVDYSQIDVVLRRGFFIAFDEIGLWGCFSLERPLSEKILHEGADIEPDLPPQSFVIGLEDHPLRSAVETLLE